MNNTSFFTTKTDSKPLKPINGILGGKNPFNKTNRTNRNNGNGGVKKIFKRLGAGAGALIGIALLVLILLYFFAFRPAYALLSNTSELNKDVASIKEAATKRDLVALEAHFNETEKDLNDFRSARDSTIAWARGFGPTKAYYADSDHFINAGLHLIDGGRELVVLVKPFSDAAGFKLSEEEQQQDATKTGLADAFATWISIMPQIANDSDKVLELLAKAGEELTYVDASRYPETFRGTPVRSNIEGAQTFLVQLNDAGPDIKRALTIIPPMLGVGTEEKRYMIMMQNDKEIRATGGFWTYFSTFKLNNALLTSDFTSYGTYNIDFTLEAIDAYYTFPTVPQAYRDHLKVERLFARDANISPDLPTAVDQFMLFWDLAQPLAPAEFKPIDGMVTIDTVVLEELLEVTGPVTLNGITYDSQTVTLELEKLASLELREQANRKKILGDLMEAMLQNVFNSDKNLWPKLVDKAFDLAHRKHIQAFVFDEEAQALLEKYNFGGQIVDPVEGDYAFLVSSNLGGGKTNTWFVNKSIDHRLEKEGDRWVRTVTAKFVYDNGKGPEYDVFKTRYQDWVRLYVPLGSELISLEGSDDSAVTAEENNKTYFSGYLTLALGETKEITFKYYLPEGVVAEDMYKLYVQKQSGIDVETHNVMVNGQTTTLELTADKKFETRL